MLRKKHQKYPSFFHYNKNLLLYAKNFKKINDTFYIVEDPFGMIKIG